MPRRIIIAFLWLATIALSMLAGLCITAGPESELDLPETRAIQRFSLNDSTKVITLSSNTTGTRQAAVVSGVTHSVLNTLVWSPDGKHLASAGKNEPTTTGGEVSSSVAVWDWPDIGRSPRLFESVPGEWINSVSWSPDGRWLAAAGSSNTALIWNANTGQQLASFPGYSALSWSPDGQRLVVGSEDGIVSVWDMTKGRIMSTFQQFASGSLISADSWSPNSELVLSASSYIGRVYVWDAETGQVKAILQTHNDSVWAATWSPDGNHIAMGGGLAEHEGSLEIWRWKQDQPSLEVRYDGGQHIGSAYPFADIRALGWSPDSNLVTEGNNQGYCWTVTVEGQTIRPYEGHIGQPLTAVAWSPDGKFIATAGNDDTIQVFAAQPD